MNRLGRLPYEVVAEAPPTQVLLAMATIHIGRHGTTKARRARTWHPPSPPRWRKIHGLVDRAASVIAAKT